MKIVSTIEARMGSTRLPGKVLKEIDGTPSLELQINRMKKSNLIDEIVLATTDNPQDDVLVDFAKKLDIPFFRGNEDDVLSRILGAVQSVEGELQVQITGDCPLADPIIIDHVITKFLENSHDIDFVSNEIVRSYPIGLDCRVFPVQVLAEVDMMCKDPIHRSHGSTYIYAGEGKNKYRCLNVMAPKQLYYPTWRWTLDTWEDLEFLRVACGHFTLTKNEVSSFDIANWLLTHPEVIALNTHIPQKKLEDG